MKITDSRNFSRPVPSTEFVRHFSDYLAQVRYGRRHFVIEKNNKPVAELRPLEPETCTLREFVERWRTHHPDPDWADALERVGRSDRPAENPWA